MKLSLSFSYLNRRKNRPAIFKNIKLSIFIYILSITIRQTAYLQKWYGLRLRKENDLWVQTFKAATKVIYIVSKKKFLGKCDQEPDLNLELYKDNKAVTDLITQALGSEVEKLSLQFETDVQRTYHVFEADYTAIEVCLDDGVVKQQQHKAKFAKLSSNLNKVQLKHLFNLLSNGLIVMNFGSMLEVKPSAVIYSHWGKLLHRLFTQKSELR